ncbi:enoyl-CoA hydratase/isomerase family protein [Rhodococcoides kroppenstedtii]|uniref:enoyl-CoA hydratase/isomerase family protein n=1 Tax=Rhodococcoides kroppenstedtii TaxID=293050 RepID=UPI0036278554
MTTSTTGASATCTIDGRIARIVLSRPASSNAIDMALAEDFRAAIDRVADDPHVQVVVLSGAGKNFCAGGDVRAMAAAPDTPAFLGDLAGKMHDALIVLDALPVVVVAAVHGSVAGAGLGLVLAADLVVAGISSKFTAAYSGVGLSPDCGVSALLPTVVGVRRAADMLLCNRVITAVEALDWGLISELVEDEQLGARVDELAAALMETPAPALGQTRRLIRTATSDALSARLHDEAASIVEVSTSVEARERIARFIRR